MTSNQPRRPRRRTDGTAPPVATGLTAEDQAVDIDFDAIHDESVTEVDADWLDRYGEADWYAAITLFGLFSVGDDTRLEDIPEEYRWRGKSRMFPNANAEDGAAT